MQIVTKASELTALSRELRIAGKTIGFVPTMGALHEGHLSLVRLSKAECARTIVSIFVNPTQFAPTEDLEKYPRTLDEDITLLETEQADMLFMPSREEMYPKDASTFVIVESVTEQFEGALRPAHFRGVATVVSSLFNIAQPDIAFFGQKDLQQAAVIKTMTRDLHFPVEIRIGEIIREPDGLAMSSRNRFLLPEERQEAGLLYKTLQYTSELIHKGDPMANVKFEGAKFFNSLKKKAVLEYLEIIGPETFQIVNSFKTKEDIAIIIAAKIGSVRLIDNVLIRNS